MPDITDLENDVAEQSRWGLDRCMVAIQRIARMLRALFTRQQQLEDRVTALEERLPPQ